MGCSSHAGGIDSQAATTACFRLAATRPPYYGRGGTPMADQVEPLSDFHEQLAIVAGASSGIGEAIAEALVQRGAHVALFARRTDRLRALAERLSRKTNGEHYGETLTVTGDVRQLEDVQRL